MSRKIKLVFPVAALVLSTYFFLFSRKFSSYWGNGLSSSNYAAKILQQQQDSLVQELDNIEERHQRTKFNLLYSAKQLSAGTHDDCTLGSFIIYLIDFGNIIQ